MDASLLQEIEAAASEYAREAGALLMEHFRTPLEIAYKGARQRDPVTNADKQSEELLTRAIRRSYPEHGIVGEESENDGGDARPDFVWVLDPLDGTTNFLNGLPVFATSIGVLHRGRPIAAAAFIPSVRHPNGAVFHARLGGGTFVEGHPVHVAENATPVQGRLTGLPSYYLRLFRFTGGLEWRLGEVRASGSVVYDIAMTSRGVLQYALFNTPYIWDVAAGALLVQEAGGRVLTRSPKEQRWTPLERFGASEVPSLKELRGWRGAILAGNPQITEYVGARTRRRSFFWRRLRRRLYEWWERRSQKAP